MGWLYRFVGVGLAVFFNGCIDGSSAPDNPSRINPPDIISNPTICVRNGEGEIDDQSSLPAFPGAQGFGAYATGGRGGQVIKVTTLSPTGAGSLQEALNVNAPRTIVFDVSGVIEGDIDVPYGNVTIAGQTAPGGGITVAGRLTGAYSSGVDNMIIRHIRVRPYFSGGDGNQLDAIQFSRNSNLIFDHVSASFAVDETIDIYEANNVTIQWSTIESSATEGHPEGEHNYGLINGPDGSRVTLHHNLFAHHKNRNPALATGPAEVRNNVIYNVRHGFIHHNPASGQFNIVGNYFRKGPNSPLFPFYFDDEDGFSSSTLGYYLHDNFIDDSDSNCEGVIEDPWTECDLDLSAPSRFRAEEEFNFLDGDTCSVVVTQSAEDAYDLVLDFAGAFPRDIVTNRSVSDTRNRAGAWGAYAVDLSSGLLATSPKTDSDSDGIPDDYESSQGLNPDDPSDNQTLLDSGYPAIEQYLNETATSLLAQ